MKFGLTIEIIDALTLVINKYHGVKRAVLFGSRARGDFKYNSDIDIAVETNGLPITGLMLELEDVSGIYKINLVNMNELMNDKLRKNIQRDGVEIFVRE